MFNDKVFSLSHAHENLNSTQRRSILQSLH